MSRYMLDTNTVSHLLKQHLMVARRVEAAPMASLCVSAITAGELLFGLAKRPDAKRLGRVVTELLRRVDALPWDNAIASCYGTVRAAMKPRGRVLVQMLSITGNIERAGFSEKIQPQINAKADANR
ncbi:MAG: VapC toxin protein, partial [Olavius algarvensis Gamma 1 endosymbiont]